MEKTDFKDISLDMRDIFHKYARAFDYENMEICFSNLFIWQKTWNIRYFEAYDSMLFCMCYGKTKAFMLPPLVRDKSVSIKPAMDACRKFMMGEMGYFLMRSVNDIIKDKIVSECPGEYKFAEDRRIAEYVYKIQELIDLKGAGFHAKRNYVNRFIKKYDYEYDNCYEKYFDECMEVFHAWTKRRGGSAWEIAAEEASIGRAFKYGRELGIKGCVIKTGGKVRAFSMGEALNSRMALIHIEKADESYEGIYQFINREFLMREWKDYEYINRQEDMGIEGLRKAKLSYHPAYLINKYNCTLKGC